MQYPMHRFKEEQIKLARRVIKRDDFDKSAVKLVAGVDTAYINNKVIAAIVVCDINTLQPVERKYAIKEAPIPYIPGFLAYRDSPAIVEAFHLLEKKPDILLVDAHGISHPRFLGMASHLVLLLDIPTIGVAKKKVCGQIQDDKLIYKDKIVAQLVQTREYAKPLFISIGHRISLKTAVEFVKRLVKPPHKLPEPLHLAHRYADKIRERELEKQKKNQE